MDEMNESNSKETLPDCFYKVKRGQNEIHGHETLAMNHPLA